MDKHPKIHLRTLSDLPPYALRAAQKAALFDMDGLMLNFITTARASRADTSNYDDQKGFILIWKKLGKPSPGFKEDKWNGVVQLIESLRFDSRRVTHMHVTNRANEQGDKCTGDVDLLLDLLVELLLRPECGVFFSGIIESVAQGNRAGCYELLITVLPQPTFYKFAWVTHETSLSRDDLARVAGGAVNPTIGSNLLRTLWLDASASQLIPGLIECADTEELNLLDLSTIYERHGDISGGLIACSLAERGLCASLSLTEAKLQSSQSAQWSSSPHHFATILQRKLGMIAPISPPRNPSSNYWIKMFAEWTGVREYKGAKILALDGGGTRSVVTTRILSEIEAAVG